MALHRRSTTPDGEYVQLSPESDSFSVRYPTLMEFLTLMRWPDGTMRETGTLLLFIDLGFVKCCLSDRDSGEVAFLTAPSVDALLGSVEAGLTANTIEWRFSKSGPKKKR